jgi:hypothetical protein
MPIIGAPDCGWACAIEFAGFGLIGAADEG